MKKLNFLILVALLLAVSGCSIFGNDDDDDDNTNISSPFEGTWVRVVDSLIFAKNKVNRVTHIDEEGTSYTASGFTYNETTKKIKIEEETDTCYYLLKNNQLFLGKKGDGWYISAYQKEDDATGSTIRVYSSSNNVNVKDQKVLIDGYYTDEDNNLNTLDYIKVISCDFINYSGETCLAELIIKNPAALENLSTDGSEVAVDGAGIRVDLTAYDTDYKKKGETEIWRVNSLKSTECLYEVDNKLSATFCDLKDSTRDLLLDTLKLDLDLSNLDAFKTMLKDL